MRKIGIVLAQTPVYSETFLVSLINGLAEKGNEVIIFAHSDEKELSYIDKNVRIVKPYTVSSSRFVQVIKTVCVLMRTFMVSPFRTLRFLRKETTDGFSISNRIKRLYMNAHILPYTIDWLYFGFATMGLMHENIAKVIGCRSATSLRGYDICIYALKHRGCYNLLFKNVDKVHSISDALYKKALLQGLSPNVNYCKISPAINTDLFCKQRIQRPINGKIKIISTGRLTWQKGYEYALEGLSKLAVDFEFTIVGEGKDRERLAYAAFQWGISDKIRLIGRKPHSEVAELLSEAHIYLQPSICEGFCNAVLEAQASGLICVVSDADGLPENVEDGKSGFVVPRRNPLAIADAITKIVNMPISDRQFMSDYAVERVRKQFDVKEQILKFIKFFE